MTTQSPFMRLVSDALGRTPIGRQLIDQARTEASDKRRALAADRDKVKAAGDAPLPALRKARAAAAKKCDASTAIARADAEALARTDNAVHAQVRSAAKRVAEIEAQLRALAPPEIDRFETFLNGIYEGLRGAGDPWGPDRPTHLRLLELVKTGHQRAEWLRTSGLTDAEIVAELAQLRDNVLAAEKTLSFRQPHGFHVAARFEVTGPEAA